jgi:hypothetical protein
MSVSKARREYAFVRAGSNVVTALSSRASTVGLEYDV